MSKSFGLEHDNQTTARYTSTLSRHQRRIQIAIIASLLATALLVTLSLTIPFFHSAKQQIEQVYLTSAKAQAAAINNQLARYQSLANQFTSRTEIRKRLEAYLNGRMTFKDTQAYSQPRLLEPMKKIRDLDVMIRMTAQGEALVSLNRSDYDLPPLNRFPQTTGLAFVNTPGTQAVWVESVAPILNTEQTVIGHDILLFDGRHLLSQLGQTDTFEEGVSLRLVNVAAKQIIAPDPQGQFLMRQPLSAKATTVLQPLNLQQPQVQEWTQDATKQVAFYVPLSLHNWGLLVEVPSDILYQTAYNDLAWALISVVLMLFLTLLIVHRAVHPVMLQLYDQTRDIEAKALELKLAASVFDHTQEAIVITDAKQRIVRANKGFQALTGTTPEHAEGTYLMQFVAENRLGANLVKQFETAIQQDSAWQGEVWYTKTLSSPFDSEAQPHSKATGHQAHQHSPKMVPAFQSTSAVRDPQGKLLYYIHICNDISERKAAENRIKRLAHNDSLTGLPNRNALMSHLYEMIDSDNLEDSTFTVMFLDLDHFKPVNDTLGHAFGDRLLKKVAERLEHNVRESDVAGRLGGDEFLLIIRDLRHLEDAAKIAEKVTHALSEPYEIDGHTVKIGASIGIAHYPQDAESVDALIQYADAAMYKIKRQQQSSSG
ncbi:MAG: diguanylate cyclase domain-containing protein [Hydrogenovibrio sp.]